MKRLHALVIATLVALMIGGMLAYANYAVNPTPSGYYLPRGYKVTAKVYVPDSPLWGNTLGDAFGISCEKYTVFALGWGEKTWNWEAKHGIKIVWREGGTDQDKAYIDLEPNKKHEVTIVYDWDGTIKISVDGKFLYGFVATEPKYTIVAQGAQVSEPEALPKPSTTSPTGSGYNPASISDLRTEYLLLGAGVAAVALLFFAFMRGKKMAAKSSFMALIIILMIVLGMIGITVYLIYRTSTAMTSILPLPLTEEIGNKPVLVALQFGEIRPGQVYEVTPDKQGWQIKQKDTHLYEKLELQDIDLTVNDVVAWHGYDVYSNGKNYILFENVDSPATSASTDEVSFAVKYYVASIPATWKPIASWAGYPDVGVDPTYLWHHLYYNSSRRSILVYGHSVYGEIGKWIDEVLVFSGKNGVRKLFRDGSIYADASGSWWADINFTITSSNFVVAAQNGYVSHAIIYTDALSDSEVQDYYSRHVIPSNGLAFIFDPTWFNGTHFVELSHGYMGAATGSGITRIPAEHPFLWLIESLKSDNKLHFMYFPEGTIIRIKDSNGNVIREFTISGKLAGNTTQVEDYAVSLDTTTLVGATVEALVPSMKVRVYAPASSYVAILGEDGTKYGEYAVGSSGYVDIPLTHPLKNAYIVVYADREQDKGLNIDVKDLGGGKLEVKIYNDRGVLIPGLLVRLVDPANVVLNYSVTDESGTAILNAGRPLAEAKILVDGVWDGTIYKLSKTVTLAETMGGEAGTVTASNENMYAKYALLGLLAVIILALLAVLVFKRR